MRVLRSGGRMVSVDRNREWSEDQVVPGLFLSETEIDAAQGRISGKYLDSHDITQGEGTVVSNAQNPDPVRIEFVIIVMKRLQPHQAFHRVWKPDVETVFCDAGNYTLCNFAQVTQHILSLIHI